MSIWDHKVKKRLRQYPKFRGGVSAVAFNCDGSRIAVGVSSTWDEGETGYKADPVIPWLGVRKVGDEVKVWGFFVLILLVTFLNSLSFSADSPFVLAKIVDGKLILCVQIIIIPPSDHAQSKIKSFAMLSQVAS